jgi:hypothetical protein
VGAIYVDNQETSAPFSGDSLKTVEALARHAALAIENALLFERERERIEELRTAQTQLLQSEKLATIGQMAAGIAHELNTPLTYIMGNLELLESQLASGAQKEMLASIAVGAERITSLAQRLLAFSRPAQEEPVEIAVNDVVERSLELCHYQILKGGVQLRKELSPSLPRVQGVANQLETALINLVVNAVHAMEGGGTLQIATTSRSGHVEIAVADTGAGIPRDPAHHLRAVLHDETRRQGDRARAVDRPHDRRAPQGTHRVHERNRRRYDFPYKPARTSVVMPGGALPSTNAPPYALRATPHVARRGVNRLLAALCLWLFVFALRGDRGCAATGAPYELRGIGDSRVADGGMPRA